MSSSSTSGLTPVPASGSAASGSIDLDWQSYSFMEIRGGVPSRDCFKSLSVDAAGSLKIAGQAPGEYRLRTPDGVIAVHVTNDSSPLDLRPVVEAVAAEHGFAAALMQAAAPILLRWSADGDDPHRAALQNLLATLGLTLFPAPGPGALGATVGDPAVLEVADWTFSAVEAVPAGGLARCPGRG